MIKRKQDRPYLQVGNVRTRIRTSEMGSEVVIVSDFNGTVTTAGHSEAIRFEKALFQTCPEFRQRAKVNAHVIGRGMLLVSLVDENIEAIDEQEDPVMDAFLSFLAQDMEHHPQRITPLSSEKLAQAVALTEGVVVTDNEILPDDLSF